MFKIIEGVWKYLVQRRMCVTCIYRPDSPLDLKKLENDVRDQYGFFKGSRICHHSDDVCCRGFWERYKDEFQAGQLAQRLGMVHFVDVDTIGRRRETTHLPGAAGSIRPFVSNSERAMPNREIKEERKLDAKGRTIPGPASPETRRAIIRKEMGLDKAPVQRDTKPVSVKESPKKVKDTPIASGVRKLTRPKENIDRKLAELGE